MRHFRFAPVALALLLATSAQAQGRLDWAATEHDFGPFAEGEQATHVFAFTNGGDRPVTLAEVRAACGCTTPTYTREAVAPGATGEITVVYNSQGRPGGFDKTVFVRAEGAEPGEFTLRIAGSVVPSAVAGGVEQGSVTFDADTFDLPPLAAVAAVGHTFHMQNNGARPIRIRAARAMAEGAEVTFPDRPVFPGEVVEITVAVPTAQQVADADGRLDVAVVLETDDAAQPTKSLRLRGTVEQAGAQ